MKSQFQFILIILSVCASYVLCEEENLSETSSVTNGGRKNFRDSLISGFSLIFISELGDKTFFITMIYAASNSFFKTLVLTGITMLSMNFLNLLIGFTLPFLLYRDYIDWIAIFVFLFIGMFLLYQGFTMKSRYIDEEYEEVVNEFRSRSSSVFKTSPLVEIENKDLQEKMLEKKDQEPAVIRGQSNAITASAYITSLIVAELGDRSQITAIIIGAIDDFYGVLLGTSFAFLLCIMTAIFFGNFLKKVLTNKELTLISAGVFLLFSLVYILEKLNFFNSANFI